MLDYSYILTEALNNKVLKHFILIVLEAIFYNIFQLV